MSTRTLSSTELKDIRAALRDFNFTHVMNLLGWNHANGQSTLSAGDDQFTLKPIAQLGGVQVIEVTSQGNPTTLPLEQTRRKISDTLTSTAREHVLIFVDAARTQSHWYWVKRELDGTRRKAQPRTHTYIKGQPDDLFIGKLSGLFVDIAELDDNGELPVLEAARRLSTALDSEAVVKKFYNEFKDVRETLAEQISGISDPKDRAWYASVLLNRLMFVYFLQGKGFLGRPGPTSDGDRRYLQHKLAASRAEGPDLYYSTFLHHLFFDAFARPEDQRSQDTKDRTGQIPYLNGGLFLKHGIELKYPGITIPDAAFDGILDLFGKYTWNLSEDDKHANGLDPDVLGHIFEKYINQKGFGAYYTRPEITEYLCEQTVEKLVLDRIRNIEPTLFQGKREDITLDEVFGRVHIDTVRHLLVSEEGLEQISLLDPACGSGAFLIAALNVMVRVYTGLMRHIDATNDPTLTRWRKELRGRHENAHYNLKKRIITKNLYGVDLMPEAAEIAKLRLFLSLVSSANTLDDLEPLPNIDFNILTGNSLIGLLEVSESEYQAQRAAATAAARAKENAQTLGAVNRPTAKIVGQPSMFEATEKTYRQIVEEYQRDVEIYRKNASEGITDLSAMRKQIEDRKVAAYQDLNPMLHKQFHDLGIKYEEVTWDAAKGKEGKTRKRALTLDDITALKPFHWAFEFAPVMARGGFDAVIANPPWDVVKPNGKEFLQSFAPTISKNNMSIKDFEKEKGKLLADPATLTEWLAYQSSFPYVSAYYRAAPQFAHQSSTVNGKKTGSDLNLYKLFLEQSYRLLRDGGECGIVIPSGVYTDLGAKGLREMLFGKSAITTLFGLSNEKFLFEEVHHSFKFCVLSFEKSGQSKTFPAAFRINPREAISKEKLRDFLHDPNQHVSISLELVRRLSPDSLSVMEFKSELDAHIAEKMLRFPLLKEESLDTWNFKMMREFHIRDDSKIFHASPDKNRLPLFTGKMFHQFELTEKSSGYWIDESVGAAALNKKSGDLSQYGRYRWTHRRIARSTDSRTLITTIAPPRVFTEVNSPIINLDKSGIKDTEVVFLTAITNSFTLDWYIRQQVTTTLNAFYVYQLPVPRLTSADPAFQPIVTAAAKLICTTPEFDDLAKAAGLQGHTDGVTDDAGRAALRAELDARVAHLYGLSESEFTHILGTFPLVDQSVKDAALAEFRRLALAGVVA
ncbi:DNA methyltransferase [Deinococcus sp. 6GRE01]|uniref:Eco57I restriction-modification methylase domain-containing protein n=1 Tax=Deinococcus sp. 6GRE01 TaxID=2745873 RepID=UPI001E2C2923|nr:DNA methyltransferase [Deinococcus sp. 6GRE01]MCD0156106.1 ATP-binding protein [Deinococcus sp. 6GRE01]